MCLSVRIMNAERRTERPRDLRRCRRCPQLHAGGGQAWEVAVSLKPVDSPAGEQLLSTLRPALGEIEAQLNSLSERRELPSGSLRLTAGRHAVETVLWPALLRLNRRYPDIKVEVSIEPALTDIVTEQYDAGVRLGEQIARDMIALRIGPDLRRVVVGCPAYLADHGIPGEPQDLTHHRCCNIRLPTSGGLYAWEFERDGH